MKRVIVLLGILWTVAAAGADYVITISVDGLGSSYMQALIDAGALPHFKQLLEEGAGTTNARTDGDMTVTLPNHVSMVTSRPIRRGAGHGWVKNTEPAKGATLHSGKGAYVAGAFDVAHDHGRRTGLWATKTKFALFQISYDAEHGAPDTCGVDNGRGKLDVFVTMKSSPMLTDDFIRNMTTNACHFSFLHFVEGDTAGHKSGWGSEAHRATIITVDACVGRVMDLMRTNPVMRGCSTLIVTADHGGKGLTHKNAAEPLDYTIPFCAWGSGVTPGELYAMNTGVRASPGMARPGNAQQPAPIRNGEVGNLMLSLLGLGPIPGSSINAQQDLRLQAKPTAR
jgi:hypothetical protein